MKSNNYQNLFYNNSNFQSNISFTPEVIRTLLSEDNLKKFLTNENISKLQKYIPESWKNIFYSPKALSDLLLNTKTKFFTPSEIFLKMYSHNFFTEFYQQNLKTFKQENLKDYIDKSIYTLQKLKSLTTNSNHTTLNSNIDNIITFDFHSDDASSGYASIDTNKDNITISDNGINDDNDDFPNPFLPNKKKKNPKTNDSIINQSEDNETIINDSILLNDRFKNIKKKKFKKQ
jgi:hypothetical protein